MLAEITVSNLYWNTEVAKFFLDSQAYETLEGLVKKAYDGAEFLNALDAKVDENEISAEDFNDDLHCLPDEEFIEKYELQEFFEEYDEDEEEEEEDYEEE